MEACGLRAARLLDNTMNPLAEPPRVLRSGRWPTWARDRRVQAGAAAAVVLVVAAIAIALARGGAQDARGPARASPFNEPTAATANPAGTFHLLTPGPTVPAGHWRWSGRVIDQAGKGLADVCVHIGPGECRFNSVRTDDQGKWVIDFPQVDVIYEFHFVKQGFQTVDQTVRTEGPGQLEVRMIPSQ
jgi:hypothetical protein